MYQSRSWKKFEQFCLLTIKSAAYFLKNLYSICYSSASVVWFGFWPQGMWDLNPLYQGIEPPALKGEIPTTGLPG